MKTANIGVASCSVLAITLACAWVSPAAAQDRTTQSDQGQAANSSSASPQVEEVVVTARKRVERLQEVPISASVQPGKALEKAGVVNLEQMTNYVPNLTIEPAPGVPSLYIRGIGSGPNNPAFEPSVGLFIDGLYLGRGRQTSLEFMDIERIEVLRGPQGALFGKNTSSGAINITTANPTDLPEASLRVTGYVAGDKGLETTGVVSGPVNDKLKARLAVRYENRDGWLTNLEKGGKEPDRENVQGRLTLVYEPTDHVSFNLKTALFSYHTSGDFFSTTPFGGRKSFTRATTPGLAEYDDGHGANVGLTTMVDLSGGYTLTAITGYSSFEYIRQVDSDFTATPLFATQFGEKFWQGSQEVRVASPTDGRFNWIAGLYAHHAESSGMLARSTITFPPFYNGTGTRVMDQDANSYSAYAQGVYNLTEHWRATAGLRGTYEEKKAVYVRDNMGSVPGSWLTSDLRGKIDETAFDPSAQVQYLTGPNMFYLSYAQGSKAGGFVAASTAVKQDGFAYKGETSHSIEAGAKLELFDRRMRLNLAVFQTKYKNLQVSAWDPTANATLTRNAADATSQGVEAEVTARINEPLTFHGSFGYLDAKYDDFPNALCVYRDPPPSGLCLENIGGTRVPRAPEYSASAALDYSQSLARGLHLNGNLTASYRSGIFLDDNLNPASYQSGFTKIDARIGIGDESGDWEVALMGRNLTKELTSSYALGTPFLTNTESFSVDPPRVIAIQFTIKK